MSRDILKNFKIDVVVDNYLRIDKADLSSEVISQMKQALSISNPKFVSAVKERASVWGIPKEIEMFNESDSQLLMPRGFAPGLKSGIEQLGGSVQFKDMRAVLRVSTPSEGVNLHSHQSKPLETLTELQQGMYEASPGAGKTVVCLELWRRVQQRTIVLVDRKNIASQWMERAKQHLNVEAGLIGDDSWDEQDLTIALVQTLRSKISTLDKDWFESWGMLIADECHHSSSNSWHEVIERFPAKYRIGVSATPDRENGSFDIARLVLGDVVCKTSKEELYENKTIVRPVVQAVKTDFNFPYFPTHTSGPGGDCMYKPDCDSQKTTHRNNFHQLLNKLVECKKRSQLIADYISSETGSTQIVISKRLKHLEAIRDFLEVDVPLLWLTGKETSKERSEVIQQASEEKVVIFSTLADEALDLPSLDVIHLTFPARSAPLVRQQVGRVERQYAGKKSPRIYDYADMEIPILRSQFNNRLNRVYVVDGYSINWLRQNKPTRLASVL